MLGDMYNVKIWPQLFYEDVQKAVHEALQQDYIMTTKVNSEKDIEELLDDRGQLKLRTPLNIFIGGQILDYRESYWFLLRKAPQ